MNWFADLMKSDEFCKMDEDKKRELNCLLAEMADNLMAIEPNKFSIQKDKAESLVYGWHFTEESAKRAVSMMENADGSKGEYWTLKDVEDVVKAMGIDLSKKSYNLYDLYYVLNMERSDYYEPDQAPQYYVKRAFQFLDDKDACEGKAKKYFVAIHLD